MPIEQALAHGKAGAVPAFSFHDCLLMWKEPYICRPFREKEYERHGQS